MTPSTMDFDFTDLERNVEDFQLLTSALSSPSGMFDDAPMGSVEPDLSNDWEMGPGNLVSTLDRQHDSPWYVYICLLD